MAIETKWLEPQKIVYQTYSGQITGPEHCAALDTCLQYLDQAASPIHLITDWRGVQEIPYLAETLSKAVKLRRHRNLGCLVVVPVNYVLIYREEILAEIVPFQYRFCLNCEEAIHFLQSLEATRIAA